MMGKANNKTLVKNTGIIAIGNISTKIINFLLLPLYTSLISTEDYGTIDLLSTYTTLILAVVSLQLYQAVFRFVAVVRDEPEKKRSTMTTIFMLSFVAATVYAIVFFALSPFLHFRQKWYLLFQVLTNMYLQMTTNAARGIGDNRIYAFSNFFSAAVTLMLNVIFLVVLRLNAMTMLWAYIIGPVAGGTVALVSKKMWRCFSFRQFSQARAKEYLKYAVPLVPNELSWWVVHASNRTIISAVLGVAVNGLIAVASKFSSIYTTIFGVFNTAWTEQCVLHFNEEGGKKYIAETTVTVTKLFVSVTVGIVAFMPFVFPVMVDSKYDAAYGLIPLYITAVFFNVLIGLISPIYLINNETGKVAASTFAAAVINIAVDVALVKYIGMYAAPISSLCAYLVISLWRLWDVERRYLKIPFGKIFLLISFPAFAVVSAGYYSKNTPFQIGCAIFACLFAFVFNRKLLNSICKTIMNKEGKKCTKNSNGY